MDYITAKFTRSQLVESVNNPRKRGEKIDVKAKVSFVEICGPLKLTKFFLYFYSSFFFEAMKLYEMIRTTFCGIKRRSYSC